MEHLETKTCACQSNVIPNTHQASTDTQVLLESFSLTDLPDCLAPNKSLSLKWQQLVTGAKRRGYFERAQGQPERGGSEWARAETRAIHRGPEREAGRGRARRSGIIRSLCGPHKRLRRKPTDGPSAPRHLGKGDRHTLTHTQTPEGCCSEHRQRSDSGHRCIWRKVQPTGTIKIIKCFAYSSIFYNC